MRPSSCTSLGLRPLLRLAYEEQADFGRVYVLMNMPVEFRHDIDRNTFNAMCDEYGGVRMYYQKLERNTAQDADDGQRGYWRMKYATEATEEEYGQKYSWHASARSGWDAVTVHMVTKMTRWNKLKSAVLVCGNESWVSHHYAYVCLIVPIGPHGQREKVDGNDMQMWNSQPSVDKNRRGMDSDVDDSDSEE